MLIMLVFSMFFLTCIAPTLPNTLIITEPEPLYLYGIKDDQARAIAYYESRLNPNARNRVTGARGLMQITPIMIREVNKICKILKLPQRYTWKDTWDPYKSVEIWYIVQGYHNPDYDLQKCCIIWFGSGIEYTGRTWKEYLTDIKMLMK